MTTILYMALILVWCIGLGQSLCYSSGRVSEVLLGLYSVPEVVLLFCYCMPPEASGCTLC